MTFQFDSFADFLDMGGYGLYVWTVYGLFVLFVLGNVLPPLMSKKTILRQLKARAEREENR